jgi:flavin-dependent dehydrogenase
MRPDRDAIMIHADVIVVGGGPAGSSCAWRLHRAGLDVVIWDRATFPRDKVCAGWITPQAVADLELDLDAYAAGRTLQPITGFRVGVIGRPHSRCVDYGRVVSYGIRRCEFDDYLLRRSGARLVLGTPVSGLRRASGAWIVNDRASAPVLVGAGGHWCPVARLLNPRARRGAVVVAQEAEVPLEPADRDGRSTAGATPELYFCDDFKGYGWVFRKQGYVNVGIGSLDPRARPAATAAFVDDLQARGVAAPTFPTSRWRGHAYRLSQPRSGRASGDGLLLAGDAIGLAYPQSGEGIRPAIESGLLAAETILEARADYSSARLAVYERRLASRFGDGHLPGSLSARLMPDRAVPWIGARLLTLPWFVRRVVLDRWFLRAAEPALSV